MKKHHPLLKKCRLFAGIAQADLETLLGFLSAKHGRFDKDNFILTAGEKTGFAGIVLTGAAHIITDDYEGRRRIIRRIESGGMFAGSFSYAQVDVLPVSVIAVEETEVLFIDCTWIDSAYPSACAFHTGLIKNWIVLLAEEKIALLQKLEHVTRPTTREKLLSYLSEQARLNRESTFSIPFNREELAHYLAVERSGLSAELSKMQNDGLIRYRKNQFELLIVPYVHEAAAASPLPP